MRLCFALLLATILLSGVAARAHGQPVRDTATTVRGLFHLLQSERPSGYRYRVVSTKPTGDSTVQTGTVYRHPAAFVYCNTTPDVTLYVDKQQLVSVDHKERRIRYQIFPTDTTWKRLERQIDDFGMGGTLLDSLFIVSGQPHIRKATKEVLTVSMRYGPESPLRTMEMEFSRKDSLFKNILYVYRRPVQAPGSNGGESMELRVLLTDFTSALPAEAAVLQNARAFTPSNLPAPYQNYSLVLP